MKPIPLFNPSTTNLELFLDLDGVFAHFDKRVFDLTGKFPNELTSSQLWKNVYRDKEFFLALEMMEDAHYLWEYSKQYTPKFLTGAPSSQIAREHKKQWVLEKEHILADGTVFVFGSDHDVIVLPRRDKKLHAGPNKVLVDDRQDNITMWVDAGGVGVLHTNVWDTILQLEDLRLSMTV
jgi:hypothetical protein